MPQLYFLSYRGLNRHYRCSTPAQYILDHTNRWLSPVTVYLPYGTLSLADKAPNCACVYNHVRTYCGLATSQICACVRIGSSPVLSGI